MSTSSTSSTSSSETGYLLSSLTGSSTLQVTGLSSGLDTDTIVEELMSVKQQPLTALQNQSSKLTDEDTALTSLQSSLQTVVADARALLDPSLYDTAQTVSSSNTATVGATATSSNGAVEGGYEVSVTQLAQSAQRTFSYTSPSAAGTVTIDGQAVSISAGESASSFAQSVNSNSSLDVYATATSSGNIVFSNRSTGAQTGSYIQVTDSSGALSEITADAKPGQNAAYSIDGVSGTSASNTVTDAIPGVTLTLNGITSSPTTVTVSAPTVNTSSVQTALNTFITDYNTAISAIETQLSTTPSSTSTTSGTTTTTSYTGTLYNDQSLRNLLGQMRSMMVQTISGASSSSLNNMLDIGVSTGATTGSGTESSSSLSGQLTLNTSALTTALTSDPDGVQSMIASWADSFSDLVGENADTGGTISQRVSANTSQISDLSNQISEMQSSLNDQQEQLVQQFAAMESALSSSQSESTWLTEQINSLSGS